MIADGILCRAKDTLNLRLYPIVLQGEDKEKRKGEHRLGQIFRSPVNHFGLLTEIVLIWLELN